MMMQATISGSKIHEVGYRVFLLDQALAIGFQRFDARNLKPNGLQQLIVRVEGESTQIESFSTFIREEHPPDAVVSDITFQEYSGHITTINDYMHLISVQQLSKGIPAIIRIERMQDQMLNKQDQMLQKMDHMESSITGEIYDLRTDLRSYLDRKLSAMEHDILQIKEKIGLV
ncbi:MAG: acylphosphatase [Methanoregula sp.]|nr:acylphosphatase [Methanoregula sp.]